MITGLTGELYTGDGYDDWVNFRTYIQVMVLITGLTLEPTYW